MKNLSFRASAVGLFAAALILGTLPACSSSKSVSGTFTGTAQGNGGDVTVTITLEDSVITNVTATGEQETKGIGDKALEKLPGEMVAGNTINVDGVSGATITSDAIKEAAANALTSAGLDPDDYQTVSTASASAEDQTIDTDVVVVGAGGAGMTAAITAATDGKDVVILESQDAAGGNSVRATGGMNAADTPYQDENTFDEAAGVEKTLAAAAESYSDNETITALAATVQEQWDAYQANPEGYFDSVELMELDTMIGGKGINDPELVKTLAENSADGIEWLSSIGADLKSVGQFGGASVKRIHRPVNDEGKTTAVGAYVVPILEQNCEDLGIDIIYNATADEILMEDGKAVGVHATGESGNDINVNAKAVVLATGGFGANNDMVKEQNPALDGYITTNAAGAQGQGITMATAEGIDAATVDMKQIQLHPTVHVDDDGNAHLITEGLRGDGAILVNQEGERFIDEVGTRDVVSAAENEQTGGYAWLIIDQAMVDDSAVIQGYIDSGYTETGKTVEELADAIGVDADTLVATMDKWNQAVEAESDPDFNRTSFVKKLDTAPYYAIKVQPGIHHTMGGLKINSSAEVLNTSDETIPGLFAAGEVTGGVHGANRLGGNAVADFVVYGRIAGASASAYAGK
jgi:fumarate reductase flavoprotein subunit